MPSHPKKSRIDLEVDPTVLIPMGAGVLAPQRFFARIDDPQLPVVVELDVDVQDGRYVATRMTLVARKRTQPVSSDTLRMIPISELVTRAAVQAPVGTSHASPLGDKTAAEIRAMGLTDDVLEAIASTYRMAVLCNIPATEAVAERLEVSRATAGRWIARARERGYLAPARVGQSGERGGRKR
jgi:hypothetical protein